LDTVNAAKPSFLWSALHQPYFFQFTPHFRIVIMYPFLPWLGLMICGYCLGKLLKHSVNGEYRKRFLRITGIILILLFIAIRFINIYGDQNTWTEQQSGTFTLLDFLDTTKYPPSLLYMLMTIGPALIFLSYAEKANNWFSCDGFSFLLQVIHLMNLFFPTSMKGICRQEWVIRYGKCTWCGCW
ncbi:MAG: hypothetical protein ABR502_12700, partial [Chitinophagaceae bacterium]